MNSVWTLTSQKPEFPALKGNATTDVLIIGGGIAGILCCYMLKAAGVDCILAEADTICSSTTKNTTAKITLQHSFIYNDIIKKYGQQKAQMYYDIQKKACEKYEELCKSIECDYEKRDSVVYTLDNRTKAIKEYEALRSLGAETCVEDKTELPFPVAAAVRVKNQAQFNPLKFLYGIAKNLPIYENTKVIELMPQKAITNHGEIRCKNIIITTHFPVLNKHGAYSLKMYQHRSYVIALEGAKNVNGMYVDEAQNGLSFRSYKNLLLLGGGDHRTGKNGGGWAQLEEFAKKYYPEAEIKYKWAAQDCMTLDKIPYIGQYAEDTSGLYTATGFNKWGISSSMAAAMLLSDIICGKENRYAQVFQPSRSVLHPQLIANIFESVLGIITPTTPRCPHLGCALKYNKYEHSWDCPCHGSRFSENGQLIDNPATDDIKPTPKL